MFFNSKRGFGAITVMPCSLFLLSALRVEKMALSVPTFNPLLLALWDSCVDVGFFSIKQNIS